MIFVKRYLIVHDQSIVILENGKPCKHCERTKQMDLPDHLVNWEVPNALLVYVEDNVIAICLDCLEETIRAH